MVIRELLKYFESNQNIIICQGRYRELYKGLTKQVNPHDEKINNLNVLYIFLDNDLYAKGFIKILVEKE